MSRKSKDQWHKVKVKVYEKYSYICYYCGIKCRYYPQEQLHGTTFPDDTVSIEHLYPRSDIRRLLAGNKQEYLRVACTKCNTSKGIIDGDPLDDTPYREENMIDIISMLYKSDYSLLNF